MKRLILLAAVILFSDVGAASTGVYELMLSKDEKLCNTVLAELNQDMGQRGEIRYATHQATPVIRWHPMKELGSPLEDSECEQFRWAKFDVNNDGKQDLVVKYSNCLQGTLTDELYFFDVGHSGLKSLRTRQEFGQHFRRAGIGFLVPRGYPFPDLPVSHPFFDEGGIQNMVINPFHFQGKIYLHIDPMRPNVHGVFMHAVGIYTGETVSPGKMKRADPVPIGQHERGLADVCYFRMSIEEGLAMTREDDGLTLRPH